MIIGFGLAFYQGWHLALVITLFTPISSYSGKLMMKNYIAISIISFKAYAKSGGIAD